MHRYEKNVVMLRPDELQAQKLCGPLSCSPEGVNARIVSDITKHLMKLILDIGKNVGTLTKVEERQLFDEVESERSGYLPAIDAYELFSRADIVAVMNPSTRVLGSLLQSSDLNPLQSVIIASTDEAQSKAAQQISSHRFHPLITKGNKAYGMVRNIFTLDLSRDYPFDEDVMESIRSAILYPRGKISDYILRADYYREAQANGTNPESREDFRPYLVEDQTDARI